MNDQFPLAEVEQLAHNYFLARLEAARNLLPELPDEDTKYWYVMDDGDVTWAYADSPQDKASAAARRRFANLFPDRKSALLEALRREIQQEVDAS